MQIREELRRRRFVLSFDTNTRELFRNQPRLFPIGQSLLRTCADQKTVAQPGLEEAIFGAFVNVHVTAEQQFDIARIHQEDD